MTSFHVSAGENIPDNFNAIIEIPADGGTVKYEVDKATGMLKVDRFMSVAMHYPCNYGYVPSTLAEDGDPLDVLVYTPHPVHPGSLLNVRPLGILMMTDEAGKDSKIFAVPTAKSCAQFSSIEALEHIPEVVLNQISHFFEQYKTLEPNKWVKVDGWAGKKEAEQALQESVARYCQHELEG